MGYHVASLEFELFGGDREAGVLPGTCCFSGKISCSDWGAGVFGMPVFGSWAAGQICSGYVVLGEGYELVRRAGGAPKNTGGGLLSCQISGN